MMNKKIFIPVILLMFAVSSCDQSRQNDELENKSYIGEKEQKLDTASITEPKKTPVKIKGENRIGTVESVFLDNFDAIQPGISYLNVKEIFPSAPAPRTQPGSNQRYTVTESKSDISLFEQTALLDFIFKNDTLSGYFLTITESDFEKAEALDEALHKRYTKKLGSCVQEKVEEDTRFLTTCYWTNKSKTLTYTYDINAGKITLYYQRSK